MTVARALDILNRWYHCKGQPRPPMQNCLCKSCRKLKPKGKP